MLSLSEVKCPHCGAKGQVMLPPQGSIVVGPCPTCGGLVALFCGTAFPLDRDIVLHGSREERWDHIMATLGSFVESRVDDLVDQLLETGVPGSEVEDEASEGSRSPITRAEIEDFIESDLPQIDKADYFRIIFD